MAFVLLRLCVCSLLLFACSAPRPSEPPAQPSPSPTPSLTPPSAAVAETPAVSTQLTPAPEPDAKPDETGWGVAAGLRYLELIRGNASADETLPMLIVIHGLGDKPSRDWLSAIDLDPQLKARMILPQAPTPYGQGFAWFPYRLRDQDDSSLAEGISHAEAGLTRAIEQLTRMRPTRGRVIVCGFSQGGMLSFALALAHPQLFQQALPISGRLPEALWPARKPQGYVPAIVALHGNADPVVSFDADAKLVQHLRDLQFPAEIAAYEGVGHHISQAMSARLRAELSSAVLAIAGKTGKH